MFFNKRIKKIAISSCVFALVFAFLAQQQSFALDTRYSYVYRKFNRGDFTISQLAPGNPGESFTEKSREWLNITKYTFSFWQYDYDRGDISDINYVEMDITDRPSMFISTVGSSNNNYTFLLVARIPDVVTKSGSDTGGETIEFAPTDVQSITFKWKNGTTYTLDVSDTFNSNYDAVKRGSVPFSIGYIADGSVPSYADIGVAINPYQMWMFDIISEQSVNPSYSILHDILDGHSNVPSNQLGWFTNKLQQQLGNFYSVYSDFLDNRPKYTYGSGSFDSIRALRVISGYYGSDVDSMNDMHSVEITVTYRYYGALVYNPYGVDYSSDNPGNLPDVVNSIQISDYAQIKPFWDILLSSTFINSALAIACAFLGIKALIKEL